MASAFQRDTTANLATSNPETQLAWHEAYRDNMQNMYRTSYQDMVHGREVAVKNDFPDGYGGHVPSLRHDVLFRNTKFDRMHDSLRGNVARDIFPSFQEQNEGIPSSTRFPRGKKKPPTAGTVPHVLVKPPWALTLALQEPPTFRTSPSNTARLGSAPTPRWHNSQSAQERSNNSARYAGQAMAGGADNMANGDLTMDAWPQSPVQTAVASANKQAKSNRMPTEEEILNESRMLGSPNARSLTSQPLSSRGHPGRVAYL